MKRLYALLALAILLAGCGARDDAKLYKQLCGTWVVTNTFPSGGSSTSTITIDRSGHYEGHTILVTRTGQTRTNDVEGTMVVSNGVLTDITGKQSGTNVNEQLSSLDIRVRLLRIDDREMVVRFDTGKGMAVYPNPTIYRRIGK